LSGWAGCTILTSETTNKTSVIILLGGIKMKLYENIPTKMHAILK
jgi:hypothetical protein